LDCRHGRFLFAVKSRSTFDLTVLDPLSGYQCGVPFPVDDRSIRFSAAVLCASQGCDHHGCQRGHFLVAVVTTNWLPRVTLGGLYSSETRVWSELTSAHHPNVKCGSHFATPSVLVGDSLYFYLDVGIIECRLGTLYLSMFRKPFDFDGRLMKAEDGGLAFATVLNATNLIMWSVDTRLHGTIGCGKP
jgi:hypothetical protein